MLQMSHLMYAFPTEFRDPLNVGGDGFRGAKSEPSGVPLLGSGQLAKAAVMDTHLEVIGITASIQNPLGDYVRISIDINVQVGHL
jgi:hypothetical protein